MSSVKKRILQSRYFPPEPTTLNIFTTNRCNFSCYYCSRNLEDDTPGIENRYGDKSEFHIGDLRPLFAKYPSIKHVSFVGIGEPFLIRDLIPMAKLCKEHSKHVSVITNGSLLHDHWGSIAPFFDEVSISLHGLAASELQRISKAGEEVFNQLIGNIHYLVYEECLLNRSLRIRASVVVLKKNLERVRSAARFCADNLIRELDIHNYLPYGLDDWENCIFDDEENYIAFLRGIAREFARTVRINLPTLVKRDDRKLSWGCTSFFSTLRVDGLGQVSGCNRIMVPMERNGNFHKERDVWVNSYFTEMRKKFSTRCDLPACCRYCPEAQ